jgi:hypothetical protein
VDGSIEALKEEKNLDWDEKEQQNDPERDAFQENSNDSSHQEGDIDTDPSAGDGNGLSENT